MYGPHFANGSSSRTRTSRGSGGFAARRAAAVRFVLPCARSFVRPLTGAARFDRFVPSPAAPRVREVRAAAGVAATRVVARVLVPAGRGFAAALDAAAFTCAVVRGDAVAARCTVFRAGAFRGAGAVLPIAAFAVVAMARFGVVPFAVAVLAPTVGVAFGARFVRVAARCFAVPLAFLAFAGAFAGAFAAGFLDAGGAFALAPFVAAAASTPVAAFGWRAGFAPDAGFARFAPTRGCPAATCSAAVARALRVAARRPFATTFADGCGTVAAAAGADRRAPFLAAPPEGDGPVVCFAGTRSRATRRSATGVGCCWVLGRRSATRLAFRSRDGFGGSSVCKVTPGTDPVNAPETIYKPMCSKEIASSWRRRRRPRGGLGRAGWAGTSWPAICEHPARRLTRGGRMDRGIDFLKSQVNNAVMQHGSFVQALQDHESQAEDPRYRDLCSRHIPAMREHQRMLEEYQRQIGAEAGTGKKLMGKAMGVARDLADATRESDFLRLVGDIVMGRQAEDTFKTFREAGRQLGNQELARIGEMGERGMDEYVKDANRLVQSLFVEHVRGTDVTARAAADLRPAP